MNRSNWKLPLIDRKFLWRNVNSEFFDPFNLNLNRRSLIVSGLVGKKIKIYNGKSNYYFFIKSGMINHKFGEFSVTKVLGQKIALRKRLKQKKKKLIKKKKK